MADRVYTTKEQKDGLGPPEVIQTIDVNRVAELMAEMKGDSVPQASSHLIDLASIVESQPRQAAAGACEKCGKSGDGCKCGKTKFVPGKGTCKTCGVPHPCSHDILAARTMGDDQAVALMNEIRNGRRMAMVAQHEQSVRTAYAAEQQRFAEQRFAERRFAERQAIAEGLDELSSIVDGIEEDAVQSEAPEFKTVDELTASQRDRFAKWAESQGWPEEYIEAFVTPKETEVGIPSHIMVVASSDKLDEATKRSMIVNMCKEAKLKPEQADRIRRFWAKELGYPDTEWIADLVAEPDIK